MKKSDLVKGNLVELRNKKQGIVVMINKTHYILFLNEKDIDLMHVYLDEYNEDLTHKKGDRNKDIVKVYSNKVEDFTKERELLWSRKDLLINAIEKVILGNMPKEFKYIARDNDGELNVYAYKPKKGKYSWYDNGTIYRLDFYNHLFVFIKWEDSEPYLIDDLVVRG